MPTKATRIDWMPGPAALAVLEQAHNRFPGFRHQDLIDYLVIAGFSALQHPQWVPPKFAGHNRKRWPTRIALPDASRDR